MDRMTKQEAAEYLGISVSTLDRYCDNEKIFPYRKIEGTRRVWYAKEELDRFIQSGSGPPSKGTVVVPAGDLLSFKHPQLGLCIGLKPLCDQKRALDRTSSG